MHFSLVHYFLIRLSNNRYNEVKQQNEQEKLIEEEKKINRYNPCPIIVLFKPVLDIWKLSIVHSILKNIQKHSK